MSIKLTSYGAVISLVFTAIGLAASGASAATCVSQSQMSVPVRDGFANAARQMVALAQGGDVAGIRAKTLPAIASDFDGIAASINNLEPSIQNATLTVDDLYLLDASKDKPGEQRTQFFCGSPIVVITFDQLPPGTYALAIVHATGVPKPQQIAIILAITPSNQWELAGFYAKPMIEADHDGLWYWTSARRFAQINAKWSAWFYYGIAQDLLSPLDFLSSPNLQKLQHEADQVHPVDFPGTNPMSLTVGGSTFQVTALNTTMEFGGLDLDVHYAPDLSQAAALREPAEARIQVTEVMNALLAQHPDLRQAFHGIWIHADQGNTTLFALELPMSQISPGSAPQVQNRPPVLR